MGDPWFLTPEEMDDQVDDSDGGESEGSGYDHPYDVSRFYIPVSAVDKKQEVVLLDDDPIPGYFHQFYNRHGQYSEWATCPKQGGNRSDWCPFCDNGYNAKPRYNYSILDMTGFTFSDDDQNIERWPVKILPAKKWLRKFIADVKEDEGTVIGQKFQVKRTGKQEDNCGNNWRDTERVDLKQIEEEHWEKILWSLERLPEPYDEQMIEGFDTDEPIPFIREGLPIGEMLRPIDPDDLHDYAMSKRDEPLKSTDYEDSGGQSGGGGGGRSGGGRSGGGRSGGRRSGGRGNRGRPSY